MDNCISIRNIRLLLLLTFCCIICCSNADHKQQQQPKSAMVVGTVYCHTCSRASHFISGASAFVECDGFRKEVKTNGRGVFRVRLPPTVHKYLDPIKACSVKLISSNAPFCSVAVSSAASTRLHLKSKRNGLHVFSAGFFSFKPMNQPELCNQEPKPVASFANRKQVNPALFYPPIPFVPSPGLPLPPNPFLPPPSLIPPVIPSPPPSLFPPLIPSPPSSFVPPIFPSPPPSLLPPFPRFPPVPFLTPPPPPPASIFPPFPFPFPPNPLFPGNPPAPRQAETSP